MPRFTPTHHGLKQLPLDFDTQEQPGSFADTLGSVLAFELAPFTPSTGTRLQAFRLTIPLSSSSASDWLAAAGLSAAAMHTIRVRKHTRPSPIRFTTSGPKQPIPCKTTNFCFDPEHKTYVCPASKTLYGHGSNCVFINVEKLAHHGDVG